MYFIVKKHQKFSILFKNHRNSFLPYKTNIKLCVFLPRMSKTTTVLKT